MNTREFKNIKKIKVLLDLRVYLNILNLVGNYLVIKSVYKYKNF